LKAIFLAYMSLKQGLMPHEKLSPLRDADLDVSTRIASELEPSAIDPAWIVDSNGIAEILRIQPRTVRFWVRNKKLPVLKLSPRCQRFRVADVIRALQRFEVKEADSATGQTK
jgi:hypothetical protein